jgi:DNA-binding winged helix-turn-helix (wHTH) protein
MDPSHLSDSLGSIGARSAVFGSVENVLKFGRLTVTPRERLLQIDGRSVELGGRAFDLLVALLETRGSIAPKDKIFEQVWPSMTVSDVSLRVQISALRQLLGSEGYTIKSVRGRGYILTESSSMTIATAGGAAPTLRPAEPNPPSRRSKRAASQDNGTSLHRSREATTVAVIDNGQHACAALQALLLSNGFKAEVFACAQAFFDRPGLTRRLSRARLSHTDADDATPVILISGNAEIPMSVTTIKRENAQVSRAVRAP